MKKRGGRVKRYRGEVRVYWQEGAKVEMVEDPNGEWVKYEDAVCKDFFDPYPMCEDQPAQIDCRLIDCRFHKDASCSNVSPAITLNIHEKFVCWSHQKKRGEIE